MDENTIDQQNRPERTEPEILVNDYGSTRDGAVVVDEADRTVLLTEDQTVVIEKGPEYNIVPSNRPRKVYSGMWGQAEVATFGLAALAIVAVVLLYLFVVAPSNREVERTKAERDRLEKELTESRGKYGNITDLEGHVAKLVSSASDFEARFLPVAATGRTALYQKINGLISSYDLINTSGPDFAPLELADQSEGNQTDQQRGRARFQSLFPGVYVTMTVEGSYHNLRRFIREIETGNDFIVVSAVELAPSDTERKTENPQNQAANPAAAANPGNGFPGYSGPNSNPAFSRGSGGFPQSGPSRSGFPQSSFPQVVTQYPQSQQIRRPEGKTHGEYVSLRLEMAAYFRRAGTLPPTTLESFPQ